MKFGDNRWYAREGELSLDEFQANLRKIIPGQLIISILFVAIYFIFIENESSGVQLKYFVSSFFIIVISQLVLFNNLLRRLRSMKKYTNRTAYLLWILFAYLPFAGIPVWMHAGFEKFKDYTIKKLLLLSAVFVMVATLVQVSFIEKYSPYTTYRFAVLRTISPALFQLITARENREYIGRVANECSNLNGVDTKVYCLKNKVLGFKKYSYFPTSSSIISYALAAREVFSNKKNEYKFQHHSLESLIALIDLPLERTLLVDKSYLFFPSYIFGLSEFIALSVVETYYYSTIVPKLINELEKIKNEVAKYELSQTLIDSINLKIQQAKILANL